MCFLWGFILGLVLFCVLCSFYNDGNVLIKTFVSFKEKYEIQIGIVKYLC